MFATIRRARAWRVAFLVATAAAVSALATSALVSGPGAASAASSAATSQTRSVSCNAYQFVAVDSNTGYDYIKTLRIRAGEVGSGFFICNPTLPTRAVVTKVQFSVLDNVSIGAVSLCAHVPVRDWALPTPLSRIRNSPHSPPPAWPRRPVLCALRTPPLRTRPSITSNFSYWLQCNLDPGGDHGGTGIYGADVIYTISNTNG